MSFIELWRLSPRDLVRAYSLRAALVGVAMLAACSSRGPQSPPPSSGTPAARPAPAAPQPPSGQVARNWDQFRLIAARRLVAANAGRTFDGPVPDVLLAIPVLEVELNADGSVRRINVMRYPTQARDTVELAMDAVRRAAPFGDVSNLPKPWRYTETFLFNDDRKFKPRTLDQ